MFIQDEYVRIQIYTTVINARPVYKCKENVMKKKKYMKTSLSQVVNQTLLHAKSTDNDMQLKCVKAKKVPRGKEIK